MADYFYKDGKKYYKKQTYSHSCNKKNNCSVETHTISGSETLVIIVPANTIRTIFEDSTHNHNKTLLQLHVAGSSTPIEVTIRTRGSRMPITATITPSETKVFQVEDFRSFALTNNSDSLDLINVFIQKTFCICCSDQNDLHGECDC